MAYIIATDANFKQEVLDYDGLVLVDIWADWCGPCKTMRPIVENIARTFRGRAKVAFMELSQSEKTASGYGVQGVPTLMFFWKGKLVSQTVGARTEEFLTKKINNYLKRLPLA